jgi:hypothetical protein
MTVIAMGTLSTITNIIMLLELLSLPKKSPKAIIYLLKKYYGIGLPKVLDLAQKYKGYNLLRCLALGYSPARCMHELLNHIPASKHPLATPIKVICPRHIADNSTTDFKMGARFIARSILEWKKESEIVITSRVFEDHQTVCDRIDNANTIEKYVREAQLWPHEEI